MPLLTVNGIECLQIVQHVDIVTSCGQSSTHWNVWRGMYHAICQRVVITNLLYAASAWMGSIHCIRYFSRLPVCCIFIFCTYCLCCRLFLDLVFSFACMFFCSFYIFWLFSAGVGEINVIIKATFVYVEVFSGVAEPVPLDDYTTLSRGHCLNIFWTSSQ